MKNITPTNNLKFNFPDIAKEWHPTKNGILIPEEVTRASYQKVWWLCPKGHEYETRVATRTRRKGTGCPYCSGRFPTKEKNFKKSYPHLAKEFHPTKNNDLKSENITSKSGKKVWWLCPKGHEYEATIGNRTRNDGCPYCGGSKVNEENNLKFLFPEIAKEWHPTKNGDLKPENIVKSSGKKVWWLCPKGHEWIAKVAHRSNGSNCPYCSNNKVSKENNLKFLFPGVAKEWHPTKNGDLKPENVTKRSSIKIWWLCFKGHEWLTAVCNRTKGSKGTGCPKCSHQSSKPEFRILSELETIFKQVDSRFKVKKTEIDIYIKDINIGIEYDGSYYHKDKDDLKKNEFFKKELIIIIRVRERPLKKLTKYDVIVDQNKLFKKDLNKVFISICNFCNPEQKKLINKYLEKKDFVNESVYKKYLSYFPAPIPIKSLSLLSPQIAKEWNYEKNYPLTPESFFANSVTKVWWLCPKGHEYEAMIGSRTKHKGTGCPYCSGRFPTKEKNFENSRPNLVKEFHPTKNGNLKIESLTIYSGKKVWWLCSKGHEWMTRVSHRSNGSNCPECFNISRKKC